MPKPNFLFIWGHVGFLYNFKVWTLLFNVPRDNVCYDLALYKYNLIEL